MGCGSCGIIVSSCTREMCDPDNFCSYGECNKIANKIVLTFDNGTVGPDAFRKNVLTMIKYLSGKIAITNAVYNVKNSLVQINKFSNKEVSREQFAKILSDAFKVSETPAANADPCAGGYNYKLSINGGLAVHSTCGHHPELEKFKDDIFAFFQI